MGEVCHITGVRSETTIYLLWDPKHDHISYDDNGEPPLHLHKTSRASKIKLQSDEARFKSYAILARITSSLKGMRLGASPRQFR